MSRFSSFNDDELKVMEWFMRNHGDLEGCITIRHNIHQEIHRELEHRDSRDYKDEKIIVEHLRKHRLEDSLSLYHIGDIPVFIHDEDSKCHYFVYKGGVYTARSSDAVVDFLKNKEKENEDS